MKNIKLKTLMLIGVLIAVIAACKGSTNGTFTGSDKQPLNITIAQNESIKFEKTSRSARTIVAAPFSAKTDLTFYLWGTAQSGQTLAPKTVTVTSEDGVIGKVVLDIDCYNWSLTLAACATADLPGNNPTEAQVLEKAVLIGYGNVDMMFTNSIKFTLTPKGLSKTGGVNLTIKLEDGMSIPNGYDVTAYIYDITTGLPIKSSDAAVISQALNKTELSSSSGTAYTANGKQIKPGTYSFQVEFTKPVGDDGIQELRKYVWNDTIIILPGKTVAEIITIPNLIGTKPISPSSFKVQFNKYMDSTDTLQDEPEETSYPGFYVAHFSWDGTAVKTEMNFALQLAELADDVEVANAVTNETEFVKYWGVAGKTNAEYSFDYLNDIRGNQRFYKGGSLFANNDWVDIYLELGKRYIARLYSENNAGYSETPTYLIIDTSTTDGWESGLSTAEVGNTLKTINRYRVKYYTQGGVWNIGEDHGEEAAGSNDKIVYWSQSSASYPVIEPRSSGINADKEKIGTSALPYLYKGPADWIYWIQDLSTGKKYDYPDDDSVPNPYVAPAYAGFKNLNLYASYSREGDIEIYNDKTYDILQAWVNAFGITGSESGGVSKVSTNNVSKGAAPATPEAGVSYLNGAATTSVSVKVPDTVKNKWKYDKVSFKISYAGMTYFNEEKVGAANNSPTEFTVTLANLPTGYVYNCLLTAQYQMTTVSYPFTVYLTD